ncbi:MAG: LacI family DNA-binding transcriptional regulator [Marinosulfonomonas sp.]
MKEKLLKPEKVTIKTVAEDAGVSVAAVSKVMRNAYGVSDNLRQKVKTSIDRLGYRPSSAARGMRGQTYTVGILMDNLRNPFLPEVIEGMNHHLAEMNFKSMLGVGRAAGKVEQSLVDSMIDFQMDGLLLVATRLSGKLLDTLAGQIPLVVVGHHEPTAEKFDTVNSDDVLGARMAVEALIAKGHKTIDMISLKAASQPDLDVYTQREIGYAAAMTDAGLADHIRIHHLDDVNKRQPGVVDEILSRPDRASAVFCWSDLDAIALINNARQRGISVPEDMAIVGYDNSPVAGLPLIDLASIDQHGELLGSIAAKTLLSRIKGRRQAEHILVQPHLVERSSL